MSDETDEGWTEEHRWWYFTATVKVRAVSEADARRVIADSELYYDAAAGPPSWGPLVNVGFLCGIE